MTNIYRDEILEPGTVPALPDRPLRLVPARGRRRRGRHARHAARAPVRQGRAGEDRAAGRPATTSTRSWRATWPTSSRRSSCRTARCCCAAATSRFAAAKCYDFEVWAPGVKAWLECSSCSNFEDFQARRMNLRFRREAGAKAEHPHTLNASGRGAAAHLRGPAREPPDRRGHGAHPGGAASVPRRPRGDRARGVKSGPLPAAPRFRRTGGYVLRAAAFLGSLLLVVSVFLFTQQAIGRLTAEVRTTSRLLAQFLATATWPAAHDPELQGITREVIGNLDFPVIITDQAGFPRAWRKTVVHPDLVPALSIDSLRDSLAVSPVIRARIERLRAEVVRLDRVNPPVPMVQLYTKAPLGAVHYGEPAALGLLRWMPYVTMVGVLLLLGLGFWGLASLRSAEKRTIWVGMARETAHQLGTPLSSLMGWVELLRGQAEAAPAGADGGGVAGRAGGDAHRDGARRGPPQQGGAALQPRRLGPAPAAAGGGPGGARGGAVRAPAAAARRGPHRAARALRGGAAHQPQRRAGRVGAREPAGERALGARQDAGRDRGARSSGAPRPRRSRSSCRTTGGG